MAAVGPISGGCKRRFAPMTSEKCHEMSDELYLEYSSAIGSLRAARKRYSDACVAQGAESWAAEQAHEYLTREIEHRDEVQGRYDAAASDRPPGERNG